VALERPLRETFLPFAPPSIGEDEIAEVIDTLRSDWITTGPKVARFEQQFATEVGAPAALALSSCTAAMHVALCSLEIGVGDQVICSPLTFCSSVHVVEHAGARPLLADVEPDTLNLDPDQVEAVAAANPAVKAIQPVHLYGHPCDLDALTAIASHRRLALVEDAAHSLPASYRGRPIGAPSRDREVVNLTAFSFYATKNLTTAEGGMLTGPPELIERARILSLHGMSRDAYNRYTQAGSWYYEVVAAGFKYNMTDIQAALGLHQLRRLPDFQARRREIAAAYERGLAEVAEIQLPTVRPEVEHAWHLYVIRLHLDRITIDRARFIEEMKLHNIGTSVHFIPVHMHPYYRDRYGYRPDDFPVARREYERMLSIPIYPRMSDRDVEDVIEAVRSIARRFRR
jgi:dTDP-4-amino-4,6-dideoxygalactose transaminase